MILYPVVVNSYGLFIVPVQCDDVVTGVAGCRVKVPVIPIRHGYVPDCFPPFPAPAAVARFQLHPSTTADCHRKSMTACKVCRPVLRAACPLVGTGHLGSIPPVQVNGGRSILNVKRRAPYL